MALASFAIYHAYRNKLDLRFILAALGFLLVGIGLWFFHMTLRYEFQLLDELPMIYATCIPFWSVFSQFKTIKGSIVVGLLIFAAANLLTVIYLHFKDPTIHQTGYAILNAGIIFQSAILAHRHVSDKAALKQLDRTMILGVSIFLAGYLLWNMDIHLCSLARATRRDWGMPYGFILEGHGWWHILTGTGVYFYLVYQEYLHCWLTGTEKFYKFEWAYGLPVVVLKDPEGLDRFKVEKLKKKTI